MVKASTLQHFSSLFRCVYPESSSLASNSSSSQSVQSNTVSINPNLTQPEQTLPEQTTTETQAEAIGWIWLGAVNNTSGTFSYEEPLIPTQSQPVTITPSIVPKPGTKVSLKTGVNLRQSIPQPPDFKLAEKVSTPLQTGQEVIIHRVEAFVDTNSNVAMTRVWAEVSSP